MDWLNFHHLLYFWVVAREGSIARACEELHLTQPTISTQIHELERSLGEKLFHKVGRNLVLTEAGQVVYSYADEIFTLGRELRNAIKGQPRNRPLRFLVGVADVLPKLIVYRLLEPAFRLPGSVQVICRQGKPEALLADLAIHELDLVLSDAPVGPGLNVRAFSHLLGECGVSFMAAPDLARKHRPAFPRRMNDAPVLLPGTGTVLRRSLDQWFDTEGITPVVKGEFADSTLLKVFGQSGVGIFPVPTAVEDEVKRQYHVELVGRVESVRERFYALSVERRLKHPAVVAISETARRQVFV